MFDFFLKKKIIKQQKEIESIEKQIYQIQTQLQSISLKNKFLIFKNELLKILDVDVSSEKGKVLLEEEAKLKQKKSEATVI